MINEESTRSGPAAAAESAHLSEVRRSFWRRKRKTLISTGLLFLTICGSTAVRARLLSMPLERDEGEYAYAGLLILQGQRPYERLYNIKWPGTYYGYALIERLFGRNTEGIHLGILLINDASIVLVFLIARRLLDSRAAAAAALAYAVLSLSPATLSLAGHAAHFVVLTTLAGVLVLQHVFRGHRSRISELSLYGLAGFFAGLAPIMKQPGIVFPLFVLTLWVHDEFRRREGWSRVLRRGSALLIGSAVPFVLMLVSVWTNHSFQTFRLWTITYARYYGGVSSAANGFENLLGGIIHSTGADFLFWLIAGLGLVLLHLNRRTRARAFLLVGLLVFSFLGTCPGLIFREHYFILMQPAIAFLFASAVFVVRRGLEYRSPQTARRWALALVLVPLALALGLQRGVLFRETPAEACRTIYGPGCPFVESVPVADYIREHTARDDAIAVLGSEPQIYFYAQRPAATGNIYTYAMMEDHPYAHTFQEQMIREIEAARPKYVVHVKMKFSWLERPESDKTLLQWFDRYSEQHLQLVGIVERDGPRGARYRWDEPNMREHKGVRTLITVYRRR